MGLRINSNISSLIALRNLNATDSRQARSFEKLATGLRIVRPQDDPTGLALRISITGSRGVDYVYDLAFLEIAVAEEDDIRWEVDDLTLLVPASDRDKLVGATLDLPSTPTQGGLVIRNPNRPNPLGDIGTLELTGEIPERVAQLIAERINPALAPPTAVAGEVPLIDMYRELPLECVPVPHACPIGIEASSARVLHIPTPGATKSGFTLPSREGPCALKFATTVPSLAPMAKTFFAVEGGATELEPCMGSSPTANTAR